MRKGKQGVITIFISLLLAGVLTFVCTVAEAVRIMGAQIESREAADSAMDSLFSEYHRRLMERYGLFFISGVYDQGQFSPNNLTRRFQEYMAYNLQPESAGIPFGHTDFWRLTVGSCKAVKYRLATDDDCSAYRQQAAESMETQVAGQLLEKLLSWEQSPFSIEELEQSFSQREQENGQEIERLQKEAADEKEVLDDASRETVGEVPETDPSNEQAQGQQKQTADPEKADNPIELIKELKKKGILQLVMPKEARLSDKAISTENCPSKRTLQKGAGKADKASFLEEATKKVLFHEYLMDRFANCMEKTETADENETVLNYELEYILAGKGSDVENLKTVVHRLLLLREGINFAYLMTDSAKQIQAETAALAVTGLAGAVPLTKAVKYGILLAWAYGESISDLKNLMAGGTLALVKTGQNWQISLENLGRLFSKESVEKRKESGGLGYEDHLRLLLYAEQEKELTLRSLDLIEQNIRHLEKNTGFRADALISGLKIQTEFDLQPLFFSFRFMKRYAGNRTLSVTLEKDYEKKSR